MGSLNRLNTQDLRIRDDTIRLEFAASFLCLLVDSTNVLLRSIVVRFQTLRIDTLSFYNKSDFSGFKIFSSSVDYIIRFPVPADIPLKPLTRKINLVSFPTAFI